MIFPRECKVWNVCAKDSTRFGMQHIRLEKDVAVVGGAAALVATNGRALAVVAVEEAEKDTAGPVTVEALKAAAKPDGRYGRPASLVCNDELRAPLKGMTFTRPEDATFPTWQAVIPETSPKTVTFGINADTLADLASALGASEGKVVLEITQDAEGKVTSAIRVRAMYRGDRLGAIMPCAE